MFTISKKLTVKNSEKQRFLKIMINLKQEHCMNKMKTTQIMRGSIIPHDKIQQNKNARTRQNLKNDDDEVGH